MDKSDRFEEQIDALDGALGNAGTMAEAFNAQLKEMGSTISDTGREVRILSGGISRGLRKAFDGLVFDGMKLSDALKGVAQSMVDAAYNAAMRPVTTHFGGLIGQGIEGLIQGFGQGAAPAGNSAAGQANGGAARSGGGGAVHVVMNISTPDADSFRRSQSQIAAQMSRALARGQRNR